MKEDAKVAVSMRLLHTSIHCLTIERDKYVLQGLSISIYLLLAMAIQTGAAKPQLLEKNMQLLSQGSKMFPLLRHTCRHT